MVFPFYVRGEAATLAVGRRKGSDPKYKVVEVSSLKMEGAEELLNSPEVQP